MEFGNLSGNIPHVFAPLRGTEPAVGIVATHHNSILDALPHDSRNEIQEQLADILHSVPFRTSRQCQDLFRFIVEHSLAGCDESLRERVIGIEVFGRSPDYDTADDPVVRVRAADVRKRLAQYYQARTAQPGDWKIEIPTGSYRAQFHLLETAAAPMAGAAMAPHGPEVVVSNDPASSLAPKSSRGKQKRLWALAVAMLCVAIGVGSAWQIRSSYAAATAFELFWAPIWDNPRAVLVCTGSNRVYRLSEEARTRYRESHPSSDDGTPNLEVLVPKEGLKSLSGEDFVPVQDTYLTVGDASAAAQISSLFTSHHHPYDLRFGSDLSFGDLRENPAVLIGAFNNSWTLNMTDNLRFVFDQGDSSKMHVQDKFDASRSWWPKLSDGKFVEDYAIVSRILDSKTGSVLVTIAGLDHTGTRAAGNFVTNPQNIADLVQQAPKDWSRKNLQVVLHTNVTHDIPGPATIVAVRYW